MELTPLQFHLMENIVIPYRQGFRCFPSFSSATTRHVYSFSIQIIIFQELINEINERNNKNVYKNTLDYYL